MGVIAANAGPCLILSYQSLRNVGVAFGSESVSQIDLHKPHLLAPLGCLIGDQQRHQEMNVIPPSTHNAFRAEPLGLQLVSVQCLNCPHVPSLW